MADTSENGYNRLNDYMRLLGKGAKFRTVPEGFLNRMLLFHNIELNWRVWIFTSQGMNHGDAAVRLRRRLHSKAKHPCRIGAQIDCTQPFAVLQWVWMDGTGMPAGQYGAIRVVEHLSRGGPKQHPLEKAGMRGHNNEIEPTYSRRSSNSIAGSPESRILGHWDNGNSAARNE